MSVSLIVLTTAVAELSCWPDRARGLAAGASGSGSANAANTDNSSNTADQHHLSQASRCQAARAAKLSRCRVVQPSHLTALYAAIQTAAEHEAAAAVAAENRRQ